MQYQDVAVTIHVRVPNKTPEKARQVLAYMAQNCDTATLASTAARFGCHPNTVAQLVRGALGATFGEALLEMRMQRAASLLDAGADVAQTARCCGYESAERFREAFRRRWGVLPAEWAASMDEARTA